MTGMIEDMHINATAMRNALQRGHPTATDLADFLVVKLGKTFRDAHHISGKIVALADENKSALEDLNLADIQKIEPKLDQSVYNILKIDNACNASSSFGGTASAQVKERLKEAAVRFDLDDKEITELINFLETLSYTIPADTLDRVIPNAVPSGIPFSYK